MIPLSRTSMFTQISDFFCEMMTLDIISELVFRASDLDICRWPHSQRGVHRLKTDD